MTQTAPVFTRMFEVQSRYGIAQDTVRRWAKAGRLSIHKEGRMSFVRHDDIVAIIDAPCGASSGAMQKNG